MGGGLDIVSGGELFRAVKAGMPLDRIVFAGVGKSDDEIAYALEKGVLLFNVESEEELVNIGAVASRVGVQAQVAIRVNPDVDPQTHPYITTGLKKSKFGIDINRGAGAVPDGGEARGRRTTGVHCHIGSQIPRAARSPIRWKSWRAWWAGCVMTATTSAT